MEEKKNQDIIYIEESAVEVPQPEVAGATVTQAPTEPQTPPVVPVGTAAVAQNATGPTDSRIINIGAIVRLLWSHKWKFLIVWVITFILSSAYILCIPRYYATSTRVAPETDTGGEGSLSSIASSFGINIGESSSSDAIYPLLYPDLMDDNEFVSKFFDVRVTSSDGVISTTYYDYLANYQLHAPWASTVEKMKKKLGLIEEPTPLKKKPNNDKFDPYVLTKKQDIVLKTIRNSVDLSYDKKTGVIGISVQDQDRQICKQVADTVRVKLQQYITEYRTKKARQDVEYYENLTAEAKGAYENVRRQYTSFADANTDIILPSLQAKAEDLENDMQLKYNTFTALSAQLQGARAKLRERTPAFTTLQGAAMPLKPAGPKRMIFVALMLFLATIATTGWYILKSEILK